MCSSDLSADFMTRNTVRRVEVAAPVLNEKLKERLDWMFETMMNDDEKGKRLTETGNYADRSLNDVKLNSCLLYTSVGVNLSSKKSDKEHQYGHERMECVSSIILSGLLLATGIGIGMNGIENIIKLSLIHI